MPFFQWQSQTIRRHATSISGWKILKKKTPYKFQTQIGASYLNSNKVIFFFPAVLKCLANKPSFYLSTQPTDGISRHRRQCRREL